VIPAAPYRFAFRQVLGLAGMQERVRAAGRRDGRAPHPSANLG